MSRIERNPITIPANVEVTLDGRLVKIKGKKGALECRIHELVKMEKNENKEIKFLLEKAEPFAVAIAGTTRAIIKNMIHGVSEGYEVKLLLEGVGYRAQAQSGFLNLTVGFSHPVKYKLPEGVTAETPSQTEIILKGVDKQVLGQVAATVRGFQPPEPYKGKGIRYEKEIIKRKEGKKK